MEMRCWTGREGSLPRQSHRLRQQWERLRRVASNRWRERLPRGVQSRRQRRRSGCRCSRGLRQDCGGTRIRDREIWNASSLPRGCRFFFGRKWKIRRGGGQESNRGRGCTVGRDERYSKGRSGHTERKILSHQYVVLLSFITTFISYSSMVLVYLYRI